MQRLVKLTYFLVALFVAVLIVYKSLDYLTPNLTYGFLADKKEAFPTYRIFLYMHIIGAPIAFFTSLFQIILTDSRQHKFIGRVYVLCVLFLAAPGGFYMSFYAIGGFWSIINFFLLSTLWFGFTMYALILIRKGEVNKHKQFMTRSFILTNSAILIRIFSFINNSVELTDVVAGYIIISWISWLPWLAIFEVLLYLREKDALNTSHNQ